MENNFKKIAVIGLGYIGLPTAAMFASHKIQVVGVDVNKVTVDTINRGEIHIVEPDLDIVVQAAVREGYLRATTTAEPAEAFLIAVPTPFKGSDREADLSYIEAASKAIAPVLERGNLVILESTSPVGTTEAMADWLALLRPDLTFPQTSRSAPDVCIAHCPERVLPGRAMQELVWNDRIIGGMTMKCSQMAKALYQTFVRGTCVVASGPRIAEMAKLAENSFRDVNIAYANEMSLICDRLGIDVWELINLANRHPRVNILQPGPGVGGHCIAIDPWFIVASAREEARLIKTAREVNDAKPGWVIEKIRAAIDNFLVDNPDKTAKSVTLAVYGLTYKPDIGDLRESPALKIFKHMLKTHPGPVLAVEPNIERLPQGCERGELVSAGRAQSEADVHLFLVKHSEFAGLAKPCRTHVDPVGQFCEA
jgi:UDP-N-acetyl-D-mannosaminuronic acid dehydrogenase